MWIEEVKDKDGYVTAFKFVKRYQDKTGRTRRVSVNMDKNTPQARNKAESILNEKIEKALNSSKEMEVTFSEISQEWLRLHEKTVKKSTYIRTRTNIRSLNEQLGCIKFDDLKAAHFNRFFMENLQSGRFKYNTAKQISSAVSRVIKYALKYHGINQMDIITHLEVPKINVTSKNDMNYLEPHELDMILKYFEENDMPEFKRLVQLQVNTGMRFGEMIALNYDTDIDLDEQTIQITKTYDAENKIFTTPKTGESRIIYFNDDIKNIIIDQIRYDRIKMLAHNLDRDNKLLFKTQFGTPITTGTMNKFLGYIEIPDKRISTHIFRHTFITFAVQNGMDKNLIAQQVGHADTSMIDRVYSHFTDGMREQQKEAMLDFKII